MTGDDIENLNPSDAPPDDAPATMSAGRKWAFRLIALAVPILLLVVLEFVLRFAGYGGYPPILADVGEVEGKHYITTIPEGIRPFFVADPDKRGSMDRQFLTMPKDEGTVRIVVVGGSAAQGYPQPRPLKLSSFLEAMLQDLWPDRKVEVINLGTTAIASFPVTRIAHAALPYDPDLLIVYTGNNEYYGACGVASTHRLGRTASAMRAFYELRRLALVQALFTPKHAPKEASDADEGLMDAVLADAQIPADDPRREAAADNLAANIQSIVAEYQAEGVPVIVCTCPGSEKNLTPIGEDAPLPAGVDQQKFDQLLAAGGANLVTAPQLALESLNEAAKLHPQHATVQYLRAQCLAALGQDAESAMAYQHARDLDTMPWRTPSTSNAAIRKVAQNDAVLCDLERAFHEHSPGGAIGWELMDDHVHPSLAGQALIAQTLLNTMTQLDGALHVDKDAVAALPDWETYADRLGANPLDAYRVVYRVTDLYNRSFFKRSNPDARNRYLAMQQRMESKMDAITRAAIKSLQTIGYQLPITGWVGEAQFRAGKYRDAANNLAIARRALPPFTFVGIQYACLETSALRRAGRATDPSLADAMVGECTIMRQLQGALPDQFDAYCACASSQAGHHAEAIPPLEASVRNAKAEFIDVLAEALADALEADGQADKAARIRQEFKLNPTAHH